MKNNHLLLSSGILPGWGTGTCIILKRHLEDLERKGWQISVIVPEHDLKSTKDFSKNWNVIFLPSRRWWWLPYRPKFPISLDFRFFAFRRECEILLKGNLPTALLTHLSGSIYAMFTSYLSKKWNIPLSVICHDREEFFANSDSEFSSVAQRCQSILLQAQRCWFVSPELKQYYNLKPEKMTSILLPVPEPYECNFVQWQDKFGSHPVVAHAGWLYPSQFLNLCLLASALKNVNGSLLIVSPKHDPTLKKLLEVCPNIIHHEPFQTNRDVLNFLADNSTCILISYSFIEIEQPWAKTSFPSKFVEFSRLGLPVIIMAPTNTAISNWAISRDWIGHISHLDEQFVNETIAKITRLESWQLMARQTCEIAVNEFNPDIIQSQFESELARVGNLG